MLRTADGITADVETNCAVVRAEEPAIMLRGTRGAFSVMPGATEGRYCVIDPGQRFPHRRSSVALPPLEEPGEKFRVSEMTVSLPDSLPAHEAFWRAVYATVRMGKPFPVDFDLVVEMARYIDIVRKSAPIAI
jgi:hypothetical protein